MSKTGESILLHLSASSNEYSANSLNQTEWNIENALSLLTKEYPNFHKLVSGKRVVDYGCGLGYQSIALCIKYNCNVVGIDTNERILNKAIDLANHNNIPKTKLVFKNAITDDMINDYDVVISQNSFEHFRDPGNVLHELQKLIYDTGKILILFGPPWFAPYGSHMHYFCKVPWINILFSESTVMRVREKFRNDGAKRYEDVESGLNKMTISKFEKIISFSNLRVIYKRYRCIKGLDILGEMPFVRELFINNISVILTKCYFYEQLGSTCK